LRVGGLVPGSEMETGMSATRVAVLASVTVAALVFVGSALAAPTATITPGVVYPTQTVTVGGSGFAASEAVDVYLDSTDLALTGTDATGALFSTPVAVPASALPGNHWVSLVGRRDGLYAQKLITVHTGWAQRGSTAVHRSLNPFENVLSRANLAGLDEEWSVPTGVVEGGAAVASGSREVIFGDNLDNVFAVSQLTGSILWERAIPGAPGMIGTPAIDSGRVYIDSANGLVSALNALTGVVLWQTPIGTNDGFSSPTVAANVVYVGSGDGNLYALNPSTGAVIWKGPTGGPVYSTPAVSGGRVFVGSRDHSVYAFAVGCATGGASCVKLWSTATGSDVLSAPAVSNGVVYVGSTDGKLYALNAANGGVLWTGALPSSPQLDSPAVANGIVYIGSFGPGVLTAFPAACGSGGATCNPLWQSTPVETMIDVTPAIANGVVYMGGSNSGGQVGLMMGFPTTCSNPCPPLWTATLPGSGSSPAISDGMVIAGFSGSAGGLTAWDLAATAHTPQPARPDPTTLEPNPLLTPTPHR
jgi:outer membrane protein assembly factor BamB